MADSMSTAVNISLPLGDYEEPMMDRSERIRNLEKIFGQSEKIAFHTSMASSEIVHISMVRHFKGAEFNLGTFGGGAQSEHRIMRYGRLVGKLVIGEHDHDESDIVDIILSPA